MGEILCLCKEMNQGVWSGPTKFAKCNEKTFIVNWGNTNTVLSND